METSNWACATCGCVGFVVHSEDEDSNGWKCFRCGNTDKAKFHQSIDEDKIRGRTLQQINTITSTKDK